MERLKIGKYDVKDIEVTLQHLRDSVTVFMTFV